MVRPMGLAAHADRFGLDGADRKWLDELALDARDDDLAPTMVVLLGLAGAELRTVPAVLKPRQQTSVRGAHAVGPRGQAA